MANLPPRAAPTLPIAPSAPQPQIAEAGPPEPPDRTASVKAEIKEEEQDEDVVQLQLGEFQLPPPPALTPQEAQNASLDCIERMFSVIDEFEKTSLISRKSKLGINRLAASNWDREGWITVLVRLPTRGCQDADIRHENGERSLPHALREALYKYIISDFRTRLDIAVAWLNEEWYNDQIMAPLVPTRQPQYEKWMMKVMDAIFPFLEVRDRMFMRTMSEIPSIPRELLDKVKLLCLDPDRSTLGIQLLQ
jgi:symplekin